MKSFTIFTKCEICLANHFFAFCKFLFSPSSLKLVLYFFLISWQLEGHWYAKHQILRNSAEEETQWISLKRSLFFLPNHYIMKWSPPQLISKHAQTFKSVAFFHSFQPTWILSLKISFCFSSEWKTAVVSSILLFHPPSCLFSFIMLTGDWNEDF